MKKTEKDPSGDSWSMYPMGKLWDEASGKMDSGMKFYLNIIPGFVVESEHFCVAIITPEIHSCMGVLEIDCDFAVFGLSGREVPRLVRCRREDWRRAWQQPLWWRLLA